MDWSRVKTILIVALLIANGIIGVFMLYDNRAAKSLSEDNQIHLINQLLEQRNIANQLTTAPTATTVPRLTISYVKDDLKLLAERLLGSDMRVGSGYYSNRQYRMNIQNDELNIERTDSRVSKQRVPSLQQAEQLATAFIAQLGYPEDYQLLSHSEIGNALELHYGQLYRQFFIDGGDMTIRVDQQSVMRFKRRWMVVTSNQLAEQPIISYYQALFNATERLIAEQPTAIVDMKLGYRLEKSILGTDIQSGDASPYYRIDLANKRHLYIAALQNIQALNRALIER